MLNFRNRGSFVFAAVLWLFVAIVLPTATFAGQGRGHGRGQERQSEQRDDRRISNNDDRRFDDRDDRRYGNRDNRRYSNNDDRRFDDRDDRRYNDRDDRRHSNNRRDKRKADKFINGHDARDGRWDGRGPRRNRNRYNNGDYLYGSQRRTNGNYLNNRSNTGARGFLSSLLGGFANGW